MESDLAIVGAEGRDFDVSCHVIGRREGTALKVAAVAVASEDRSSPQLTVIYFSMAFREVHTSRCFYCSLSFQAFYCPAKPHTPVESLILAISDAVIHSLLAFNHISNTLFESFECSAPPSTSISFPLSCCLNFPSRNPRRSFQTFGSFIVFMKLGERPTGCVLSDEYSGFIIMSILSRSIGTEMEGDFVRP